MEHDAVLSSSLDSAKAKREKIIRNANHYKNVLKTWENAVSKAEGRKPGKEDLKTAPDSVQKAYKEYYKLKKYLESNSSLKTDKTTTSSSSKGPSPSKIFFGRTNVRGNSFGGGGYGRSPSKSPISRKALTKKQTGILKAKESLNAKQQAKHAAGVNFSTFNERISFVVNILGNKSPNPKTKPSSATATTTTTTTDGEVKDGHDDLRTRKFLVPYRFTKSAAALRSSSMSSDNDPPPVSEPKDGQGDKAAFQEDETDHIPVPTKAVAVVQDNNDSNSSQMSRKRNSVSAIWHSFSPNPKSKKKEGTKHVDKEWLKRCRTISQPGEDGDRRNEETGENCISSSAIQVQTASFDSDEEEQSGTRETSASSALFSQSFKDFLLSAEGTTKQNDQTYAPHSESTLAIPTLNTSNSNNMDNSETFDSGLGMSNNCVFSAQEIMDIITNEVLPETAPPTDKDNIHNENACSPPESNFHTIDISAMSSLISANPFASAISPTNVTPRTPDSSRKRKATALLYSPSPKKPSPKKKFFTSSRIKAKYGIQSYKPPTPSKSKRKEVKTTSTAAAGTASHSQNKITTKKMIPESNLSDGSLSINGINPNIEKPASKVQAKRPSRVNAKKMPSSLGVDDSTTQPSAPTSSATTQSEAHSKSLSKLEYFDEAAQDSYGGKQKGRKRRKLENGESLSTRMKKGKANDNFVRIDITKKVFVRGHKKVSGAKVKRNDWKMKKANASKEDKLKSLVCRKCGETGHFAKFCMTGIVPTEEPQEIDDSPFPSLAEAASMAKSNHGGIPSHRVNIYDDAVESPVSKEPDPIVFRLVAVSADVTPPASEEMVPETDSNLNQIQSSGIKPVQPYFLPDHRGLLSQEEEDEILNATIRKFGFEDFRPGQKEVVSRILKGLSTLCILSTGSGKSLCYQLPAFLYAQKNPGALAICVSPLVSLMEDQVQGIPPFLHAEFLHSNMPSSQKEKVLEKIRARKVHILLVSPEAVCGGLFGLLRGSDFLPQISFACIDEVHCVSQWSHNFRPCYLQLAKILRDKLHVNTILGLTATATEYTANSICNTIRVDPSTTIRGEIIPDNLNLSASRDTYRDEALLELLNGERFEECDSIIIYCTRRDECQRIAALIRTRLQEPQSKHAGITKINLRQRVSNTCEAYHAGMTAGKRRLVQQQFMSGRIRIVVATVAFGMGIDKSDIRSVIHYNMPKTFESYVQEIGRAGRDGKPAHCHLFLDNVKGRDLSELKRHVYCNSIDRATLRKLLRRVFQSCKCDRIAEFSQNGPTLSNKKPATNRKCPGHEVSFSIEETVQELDLPEENITTILCYLELDSNRKWIEMLPHTYQTCKIHSYGGAALLKSAALRCPPLAAAIALKKEKKKFNDADVYIEFDVIEVSATLGWNSGAVKKELKNLEWTGTGGIGGKFRKSGILVEFCNLAFHINSPGGLSDEDSDIVLNYLHNHNQEQEKTQLYQLHRVYQALLSISSNTVETVSETFDEEKSNELKKFIRTYFLQKTLGVPPEWKTEVTVPEHQEDEVRHRIGELLASVKDAEFTGRSVARIFQGISSPCFPAEDWARNRSFWRKHIDLDFHYLCKIASQEILRF